LSRKPFRLVSSREIYRGHIIRLVKDRFILKRDPKKLVTRELVEHPGAVVIVPYVGKDRLLLIRQFRYAAKGDLWEIPAGTLEKGEATLSCAKRELEEETGFRAKKWTFLSRFFPAPGISDELMTLYRAEKLFDGTKNLDHDEWIDHKTVRVRDALRMIKRGTIRDGKTIAGILWSAL
jgi:ADP-ribose pyrophosphatase